MSFNLEVINTGTTANDGNGDPLRTAFYYTYSNDLILSGEIVDLSGNLSAASTAADNALSARIESTGSNLQSQLPIETNRTYNNLNSGEYIDITGSGTAIPNGDYSLSVSEFHHGTGTSYSSSPYSYGITSFNHGLNRNVTNYYIGFPVHSIGGPFDTNKDYNIQNNHYSFWDGSTEHHFYSLRVTRTSDPKDVTVSGAGTVTTALDGTSYHYLQVHLREY